LRVDKFGNFQIRNTISEWILNKKEENKVILCAVVVICNVHPCNSESINSLKDQIKKSYPKIPLVIYDNTENPSWTEKDLNGLKEIFNLEYISDKSNPGIAKAYNYALNYAFNKGFAWLLVLDQDTDLSPSFIMDTMKIITSNKENKDIVLFMPIVKCAGKYISPCKHSFARIKPLKNPLTSGPYCTEKISAINSGMMVNIDFLISIGGYLEKYPLDYLDHWLMAEIYKQKKLFFTTNLEITHHLASMEKSDLHTALARHRTQVLSIINYYKEHSSTFEYMLSLLYGLARSLKLSICYGNFSFFRIPGFCDCLIRKKSRIC